MLIEESACITEPCTLIHTLVAAGDIRVITHNTGGNSFLVVVAVEEVIAASGGERPDGFTHAVAHIGMAFKEEVRLCRRCHKTAGSCAVLVIAAKGTAHYPVKT